MSTGTNSREMATLDPATIGQPEWHVRFSFILLGIARNHAVNPLKKNPHLSKFKVNLTRLVAGVDGERAHSCGQSSEKKSTSIENWGQSNVIGGWRGFSLSRARENRAACLFRNIPGLFEIDATAATVHAVALLWNRMPCERVPHLPDVRNIPEHTHINILI